MSYSPTRTLILPSKAELYKPEIINGFAYKKEIPKEYRKEYQEAIKVHGSYYYQLADKFHEVYPEPPYTFSQFLHFLKDYIGISSTVYGFINPFEHKTHGTWCWDNEEKDSINIYVANDLPYNKVKATVIHEAIHPIQDFDYCFQELLEHYSIPIRIKIADRIAEKTMVEILLPRDQVEHDIKRIGLNPYQVALKYGISIEMASYAF